VSAWNRCAGWTLIRAKTPPNAQGTLEIDGTSFSGQVSGFAPGDRLDFADLAFGSKTTVEYDVTTHHLTVSDGVKVADVTLLGTYTASKGQTRSRRTKAIANYSFSPPIAL
jgi:hypothetical protein